MKKLFQCPCCDYFTLEEVGGYIICPVCFWEDDGLDIDRLDEVSGPNHITLAEGRKNFMEYGACDLNSKKYVISEDRRKKYKYSKRT